MHSKIFNYLKKTNNSSKEELESIQLGELNRLLQNTVEHSNYYRNILPAKVNSLQQFYSTAPILSRHSYQENFKSIVVGTMPQNMQFTTPIFSSGSTGIPVEVHQTNATQSWHRALQLRDMDWSGINPANSMAVIKYASDAKKIEKGIEALTWEPWIDKIMPTGRTFALSIDCDPKEQLAWLKKVNADYLMTYPSNLESLLDQMDMDGPLEFDAVICLSEPLTENLKLRAEQNFPVKNIYSSQEVGYIASQCEQGNLHVHDENLIVEVVNDNGERCATGESGKVLVTSLRNFCTPLIRYDIGDKATVGEGCACGRKHTVLKRIDGKVHPLFNLNDGSVKNSMEIAVFMRKIGGSKQFQVINKSSSVHINILPNHEWGKDKQKLIEEHMHGFFKDAIPVHIELVQRIPLYKGKLRHLINA